MPLPGEGVGEGVGVGDGDGDGDTVPPLLVRDGTPLVDTGEGDVGSTEPQLVATNASTSEAKSMGIRMRRALRKSRT